MISRMLLLVTLVFLTASCRTGENESGLSSWFKKKKKETEKPIKPEKPTEPENPDRPAPNQPWLGYYGTGAASGDLFNLSDDALKTALFNVLDSVHCVDTENMRPDQFIASPVIDDDGYHYIKWIDQVRMECHRKFPNSVAKMHRALGYGNNDRVNPRDYPELRNARHYMYHHPKMGHFKQDQQGKYIIDVYAEQRYGEDIGVGKADGKNPDGNILNCEHTWPKSRFGVKNKGGAGYRERLSDLHHLFPTSNPLNGWRSSYYFGELENGAPRRGGPNDNKVGLGSVNLTPRPGIQLSLENAQYGNKFFEPPVAHRGNVARALFYFSVRYRQPIHPAEEFYLRKWHKDDPADDAEILRNETVAELQQTRNPFIDFPAMVDQISDF